MASTSPKSTILITGSSGLLGRSIYSTLSKLSSYNVIGTYYNNKINNDENMIYLDLTDITNISEALNKVKPNIIILSAAERKPDIISNKLDYTKKLNVESTEYISNYAKLNNIFLIYISTDYVFDGTNPPYNTYSQPNPLNEYGITKYQGELALTSNLDVSKYCILRIPILYGDIKSLDESALTSMFTLLKSNKETIVDNICVRYPTHTDDVSKAIKGIIEKGLHGIYHYSSSELYTKYTVLKMVAEKLNYDIRHLIPGEVKGAPRPLNSQLDISSLENDGVKFESIKIEDALPKIVKKFL